MPYSQVSDLPDEVRDNLPIEAQEVWLSTFNAVLAETNDEEKALLAAWGAARKLSVKAYKSADGENKVKGWAMLFTGADDLDLEDTFFDQATDLLLQYYPSAPLWYEHGKSPDYKLDPVGQRSGVRVFRHGVWLEHDLHPEHVQYDRTLDEIGQGLLSYSSDTLGHLAYQEYDKASGHLGFWAVAGCSLTKTPAEPGLGPVTLEAFKSTLDAVEAQAAQDSGQQLYHPSEAHWAQRTKIDAKFTLSTGGQSMPTRKEILNSLRENLVAAFPELFTEGTGDDEIADAVNELAAQVEGKDVPEAAKAEVDLPALIMALGLPEDATPEVVAQTLRDLADMLVAPSEEEPPEEEPPAGAQTARRSVRLHSLQAAAKSASQLQEYGRRPFKTRSGRSRSAPVQIGRAHKPSIGGMVQDLYAGKAQSYNMGALGGFMVDHEVSPDILDYLYKNEIALAAGAQEYQISGSESITFLVNDGVPSAYWVGEAKQVATSDMTLKPITAYPKVLAARVMIPRKQLDNSRLIERRLNTVIPRALTQELDRVVFYGHGAAESGNNTGAQPLGLKNITGVTKTALATNGRVPTFKDLLDAEGRVEDENVVIESGAWAMAPRTKRTFKGMTDADGNPLMVDSFADGEFPTLWGYPYYQSNMIPRTLTVGTSLDTSDIFFGNWGESAVVMSQDIEIAVDDRQYFDTMQVQILAYMYVDFLCFRTEAFEVITGVRA